MRPVLVHLEEVHHEGDHNGAAAEADKSSEDASTQTYQEGHITSISHSGLGTYLSNLPALRSFMAVLATSSIRLAVDPGLMVSERTLHINRPVEVS